ncbi:MAG: fumarate hydratase [Deltaproteobacteria bacterium]|nr:fumarate hydratase [Deltaproteobacteria bacterium]
MRRIEINAVRQVVSELFRETAVKLPPFVEEDLEKARENETSPLGRRTLQVLRENARLAQEEKIPLCQDAGLPQVLIEAGEGVYFTGGSLLEAAAQGAREAYVEARLRLSGADPLTRRNLAEKIPVSVEYVPVPGTRVRVSTLAKGGGCDNKSALFNLSPTAPSSLVKEKILEVFHRAGPDACPPYYAGICIGGSFESAPRHARRALWDLAFRTPAAEEEEEERLSLEYLEAVNASGAGPMALGGRTTALGIRTRLVPTHIASLPVAVNLSCHSLRAGRREI